MNIDIFITCYKPDREWAAMLLRSIKKNLTGYRDIVLVYAGEWREMVLPLKLSFACYDLNPRLFVVPEREPGHNNQQFLKMTADRFVRGGCDWICQIDSDCFFERPTSTDELFVEGKPIWHYGDWKDRDRWRKGSESVLGNPIPHHMMSRMGMCFRPRDLRLFRGHVIRQQEEPEGIEFDDIIFDSWDYTSAWAYPLRDGHMRVRGEPTVSEYHMMGGYMWAARHDTYHWVRSAPRAAWPNPEEPGAFVRQYWSHSGLTAEIRAEMEEKLV
ncbi:MAG: hypothetical protein E4G90_05430 [Gemmatimonadales bacterium]|nr:MAG: hypothetical protein E4G90_05430 [Gemmatimonadales bacterium]